MALTYAEQLDSVQVAITSIETNAQEAAYNGQRVKKADIEYLYKERARLTVLAKRESRGGGVRVRGGVPL